ncbi:uncharacterized protein LOC123267918 [Cotesia glomerata]|uniref:uncharacterized protein LOC123267918 n=1 Tax=Cotesia glomerata TaxID=32391 RepID=UPI001D009E52|nr:uncharacterized protein LOC123267918 [Cotesia glomerata]
MIIIVPFINDNSFGHSCSVCDRLWYKNDLKKPSGEHKDILTKIIPNIPMANTQLCNTCVQALNKNNIPLMSTYNGFKFPEMPENLPALDLISERLISPRIPFMQIRRLRHVNGQYGIYGQIINVPVSVNNMVKSFPRNVDDDYCINVHIKRKKIHRSSYLHGIINERTIKTWLRFLISTPLYTMYDIKIDDSFFTDNQIDDQIQQADISEHIPIEESLTAQQQTLMWDEEQYLRIAPGEENAPQSLLFDEHAEELSFPAVYLGQFRNFKDDVKVTPFAMASSELRRSDRRAVTPYHLLYMAMKIMRIRVRDSLTIAFKHVGKDTKITRQQIEDDEYIHNCIETNLAFLRSIPNSTWYWMDRKKDLFAMIRQFGKPTVFLTVSANEIGWNDLLQKLYKLKHNGESTISEEVAEILHYLEKTTLVNEDAVTCAIHFNKLVNVLLKILTSPKISPFGKYYVVHYFKRIEFQHRGSPHAHTLLWLANAPLDALDKNKLDAITLIDYLISFSSQEASNNIKLQTHKHTFTCYKKIVANKPQQCRFEALFMPSRSTTILSPMQKDEPNFKDYAQHYNNILRAGIKRPRVFVKRQPCEKWHNPFNPFVFNIVRSNMDIQFITEEYSCANYVAEYVNKTNRGVSHLQRQIIEIMDEHPEFDVVEITRKIGVNMLNGVEITSQEAAWYLLREPMSKCSTVVTTIPTMWPVDRQRIKKTQKELDALGIGADSTNIWKENWFDKYKRRHEDLENVTLAQFVAVYTIKSNGTYTKRKAPRVIRYRNYDMGKDLNEYKREMVTLHFPFRNEDEEILAEIKFIEIYNNNENIILNRRKEFESNLDTQKTIEICRNLCREDDFQDENEVQDVVNVMPDPNPFQNLYDNPISDVNSDLRLAVLNKLGPIAKKRENLMPNAEFFELMRMANDKQQELLLHVISNLLSSNSDPFQIFFTVPAGCGKTFVIKLLMEIYNRFTDNDGYCNSYIACASTGKAAVAVDGTTVHTALKVSLSKLLPLSTEVAHQYRTLFKYVKVLIVDEISMVGAELLAQIDSRLKQITGNININFGGIDVIFIGDLRQLPPVRATPIYKQQKQRIVGPVLWRGLKFYELKQVMRQANQQFSTILTKIGNGEQLDDFELNLLESRFVTIQEGETKCPHGIRLFNTNEAVPKDVFIGCTSAEQTTSFRQKLHKISLIDTGGLPYETVFVVNVFYMITTNIDVSDGLANGAVGRLVYIEYNDDRDVNVVWLEFPNSLKIGQKIRRKVAGHVAAHQISKTAVPITRRSSTIPLNNSKTINVKRSHLPLVCACATTIHKSQGSTYPEIVYEYKKKHPWSLVYVALSRVTSIDGLYITTRDNDKTFFHGRRPSTAIANLRNEFQRLLNNRLNTIIQYKRPNRRAGGVAIYHGANDTTSIITPCIDMTVRQSEFVSSSTSPVGKFCVAECIMEDVSTTRHGTTIDAVFTRYLSNVSTRSFISYFSYHKPLVTHMPIQSLPEESANIE